MALDLTKSPDTALGLLDCLERVQAAAVRPVPTAQDQLDQLRMLCADQGVQATAAQLAQAVALHRHEPSAIRLPATPLPWRRPGSRLSWTLQRTCRTLVRHSLVFLARRCAAQTFLVPWLIGLGLPATVCLVPAYLLVSHWGLDAVGAYTAAIVLALFGGLFYALVGLPILMKDLGYLTRSWRDRALTAAADIQPYAVELREIQAWVKTPGLAGALRTVMNSPVPFLGLDRRGAQRTVQRHVHACDATQAHAAAAVREAQIRQFLNQPDLETA